MTSDTHLGLERGRKLYALLRDHSTSSIEDGAAGGDGYHGLWGPPQEVKILPRDWSCDILVKTVACLNSLPEAKVKNFELIP